MSALVETHHQSPRLGPCASTSEGPSHPANRSSEADILKGAAILGVVFIHASGLAGDLGLTGEILKSLARLAVPTFVVLFSYFLEKGLQKRPSAWRYLASRFVALLVPFVVWSTIYFLWLADFGTLTLQKALTMHWSGYGWSGQYFFIILFQLLVVFPFLRKIAKSQSISLILIISTLLLFTAWPTLLNNNLPDIVTKLGYRPVIFWMAYAVLGIRMAHGVRPLVSSPSIFAVLLLVPLEQIVMKRPPPIGWDYLSPSIFIATSLVVPIFVLGPPFAHRLPIPLQRILRVLAKNSMVIFVSNPAAVLLFALAISTRSPDTLPVRLVWILLIVSSICCAAIALRRVLHSARLRACAP